MRKQSTRGRKLTLFDVLIGVLAYLGTRHRVARVPYNDLYRAVNQLQDRYPQYFGDLHFQDLSGFPYSKALDAEISRLIRYGVGVDNPDFEYLRLDRRSCKEDLHLLTEEFGRDIEKTLRPIAEDFRSVLSTLAGQVS